MEFFIGVVVGVIVVLLVWRFILSSKFKRPLSSSQPYLSTESIQFLNMAFQKLAEKGQRKITALELATEANKLSQEEYRHYRNSYSPSIRLSGAPPIPSTGRYIEGKESEQFLAQKAKEFNARYEVSEGGVVMYIFE